MTICPVAMAVGCRRCPVFTICPAKNIIGDNKKEEPVNIKQRKSSQTRSKKR
jgi:hypothetical protein